MTETSSNDEALHQIIYYSATTSPLSKSTLRKLSDDASAVNREHAVTGVLIHSKGSFFQILEGPRASLDTIFEQRIKRSKLHSGIIVAENRPIERRTFQEWRMAVYEVMNGDPFGPESITRENMSVLLREMEEGAGEALTLSLLGSFIRSQTPFAGPF